MRRRTMGSWLALCLLVVWTTACGTSSAKNTKKNDAAQTAQNTNQYKIEPQVGGPGEIVKKYDLNKDKRADLWKVYVRKKNSQGKQRLALVRFEIDLNADGKIDMRRYYTREVISREDFDLDYDGRIDLVSHYSQGLLHKQAYFLRSKKRPDVFKYYEAVGKRKKKKARLVRKERDTNLDGKIDYWEYWENGQLDRIGRDTDFDGNVDVWEKGESLS